MRYNFTLTLRIHSDTSSSRSILVAESYSANTISFVEDAVHTSLSAGTTAATPVDPEVVVTATSTGRVNSETWEPLEKLAKGEVCSMLCCFVCAGLSMCQRVASLRRKQMVSAIWHITDGVHISLIQPLTFDSHSLSPVLAIPHSLFPSFSHSLSLPHSVPHRGGPGRLCTSPRSTRSSRRRTRAGPTGENAYALSLSIMYSAQGLRRSAHL